MSLKALAVLLLGLASFAHAEKECLMDRMTMIGDDTLEKCELYSEVLTLTAKLDMYSGMDSPVVIVNRPGHDGPPFAFIPEDPSMGFDQLVEECQNYFGFSNTEMVFAYSFPEDTGVGHTFEVYDDVSLSRAYTLGARLEQKVLELTPELLSASPTPAPVDPTTSPTLAPTTGLGNYVGYWDQPGNNYNIGGTSDESAAYNVVLGHGDTGCNSQYSGSHWCTFEEVQESQNTGWQQNSGLMIVAPPAPNTSGGTGWQSGYGYRFQCFQNGAPYSGGGFHCNGQHLLCCK